MKEMPLRPFPIAGPAIAAIALAAIALAAIALAALVASCTPAQQARVQQADAALQQACGELVTVANIAGLVPGVGAFEPYIQAACIASDGLAKLALDPSSIAWLNQMNTNIRALAANAGMRLP